VNDAAGNRQRSFWKEKYPYNGVKIIKNILNINRVILVLNVNILLCIKLYIIR